MLTVLSYVLTILSLFQTQLCYVLTVLSLQQTQLSYQSKYANEQTINFTPHDV